MVLSRMVGIKAVMGVTVAVCVGMLFAAGSVMAAGAKPGWLIMSVAQPTNFPSQNTEGCELSNSSCNDYKVIVKNVGGAATSGKVTIVDVPPAGTTAVEVESDSRSLGLTCSLGLRVTCVDEGSVPAGAAVGFAVYVKVNTGASGDLTNTATVEGGAEGVASATTITQNEASNKEAPFEISDFGIDLTNAEGRQDATAGDHPYAIATDLYFTTGSKVGKNNVEYFEPEHPKSILVDLPVGLSGDPLATPRCPESALEYELADASQCPPDTQVGTVWIMAGSGLGQLKGGGLGGFGFAEPDEFGIPVYNLVPEHGYPAEFGFIYLGEPVTMYANAVHTNGEYHVQIAVPGTIRGFPIYGVIVTLWGTPSDPSHTPERERQYEEVGGAEGTGEPTPFLTNPTYCTNEPQTASVAIDTWEHPNRWVSRETTVYPQITGCSQLQFQSALTMQPELFSADTPSGYTSNLIVPQPPNKNQVLATPNPRDVTVTLPAGLAVSPSVASGLVACQAEGPAGINIGSGETNLEGADLGDPEATELGEGARDGSPYEDGIYHTAHGHCPAASRVGSVEIVTPVLASPLKGSVFIAQPECEPCSSADAEEGRLAGLYVEAEGSGVLVKLKGKVEIGDGGPHSLASGLSTGQLRTSFDEIPQLGPIGEASFRFYGGPRAALANPQACGSYTTVSAISPWSAPFTADVFPTSSFNITGCGGGMGLAPGFTAGTLSPVAESYSPLSVTLARHDGEQDLAGLTVQLPPGVLANIASVPLCGIPQAESGTCPSSSQIGTATVAAGAGTSPFWLSGPVYLTGPYDGAPFGISVVVPAKAGPFNLGTVVQRAGININPNTAAVTVSTNGIPQSRDGVPFRLQDINVTVNRPGFAFNPTNCEQKQITGSVSGDLAGEEQGGSVGISSPFAAVGCKGLPFNPKFTASTQAKTSKANGASLTVKVAEQPGEANIRKVDLQLPLALPSRLTTLQKACTEAQFATNPAGCPAASDIGTATAHSPVLQAPLTGPVYLVSHGGAAFPDVEFLLQANERGGNIEIVLDGGTDIKKGITYSKFETVPDAPISSFETTLPEGPHSVLSTNIPTKAKGSLCGLSLTMPTTITGQNGAQVKQTTKIAVTGCPKVKKAKKKAESHAGKNKGKKK
jgi:hypothetical protein